jgi:hypothetical protein
MKIAERTATWRRERRVLAAARANDPRVVLSEKTCRCQALRWHSGDVKL